MFHVMEITSVKNPDITGTWKCKKEKLERTLEMLPRDPQMCEQSWPFMLWWKKAVAVLSGNLSSANYEY